MSDEAQPWQPNLSWITDRIAVGGRVPSRRAADLFHLGIGGVIDLRSEDKDDGADLAGHGIAFLHLPTEDHGALAPEAIRDGLFFVESILVGGMKVLIHCEHGIGRSATLALCAMVRQGYAPLEALALAKDKRALISPSPAQYEGWAAWLGEIRHRDGFDWDIPTFDAFKAIAYRHLGP